MKNHSAQVPGSEFLHVSYERAVAHVHVRGEWMLNQREAIEVAMKMALLAIPITIREVKIECSDLQAMDTNGALQLRHCVQTMGSRFPNIHWVNIPKRIAPLLSSILQAEIDELEQIQEHIPFAERFFAPIGKALASSYDDAKQILSFLGALLLIFWDILRGKTPFRMTSMIYHIEQAGLKAVPIMALMSFLIGAIIAQQGAYQLRRFGADVLVVNLVGVLTLREMGVLLTAIMFAGRSGSAFTAEIGAMKMREEIDALKVMGRDPLAVLVMPRLCALVISLPLLTVISDFFALFGAIMLSWVYSGIEPVAFIAQLREAVGMNTFITGVAKAPFMALIIGIISCIEGLKVEGSTDSLGRQTTLSVVKSIFVVIVLDGIFAIVVAKMNW